MLLYGKFSQCIKFPGSFCRVLRGLIQFSVVFFVFFFSLFYVSFLTYRNYYE